ncbi:MAG TPA: potassium transporter TrkG [Steroidobacteraceae bacterium]|nr:potassium transporter TrkG [Steroidobacteraceae bacterium]
MLAVVHVLGQMLAFFGAAYILPIACSLLTSDGLALYFLAGAGATTGLGLALVGATRKSRRELKPRDGFLLVTAGWILTSALATIPLLLAMPRLGFTRAFFETMSGLTTTGSTVLSGLDHLAPSLNLWRHALQWVGGLAIIVMALAVLPVLGIGGMQLYKSQTPGQIKDDRLAPRIAQTARSLWLVYTTLTVAGIIALRICGMSWLDAICHAFSAVGLGGFSTHDANVAWFNSTAIELVLMALMLIASLNFARHIVAFRRLSTQPYTRDPESRAIVLVLAASIVLITALLSWHGRYPNVLVSLRHAAFNVISMATTSGLSTEDLDTWPVFAPFWLLFLSCIVCSTGSPGGGIKMFRALVLAKQAHHELKMLVHPSAVVPVRIGGRPIPERVADAVLGFIFLYFMTVALLTFALLLTGLDFDSSFSAIVAAINNTAHGLHTKGPVSNYHALTAAQTWICTAAMLLGRLEIFSVIVLFTPAFWRK